MNQTVRTISLFCLIFIILSAAYFPILFTPYIHHDDVKFFLKTPTKLMNPDFYQNVFLGRLLGAMRLTMYSFFINTISDLTFFRFINVLFLALSAWLMSLQLRNYFKNDVCALIASLIIFTLPPFQILASLVGFCATPIALFLSILAANWIGRPLWSLLLLLMSLLLYQSIAMFYWVIVAIKILAIPKESSDQSLKNLVNPFFTGFGALYAFYDVYKTLL